jgi:adenine-specific DNA glycosylase
VTQGEHKMPERPAMMSREVAHALVVRIGADASKREVLLEQRPASLTVMPGMWELPTLKKFAVPDDELRMTVRHAIMQVNYYVRIRTVFEDDVESLAVAGGERRWVALSQAGEMALTGLARKVLTRARLLPTVTLDVIASQDGGDLL